MAKKSSNNCKHWVRAWLPIAKHPFLNLCLGQGHICSQTTHHQYHGHGCQDNRWHLLHHLDKSWKFSEYGLHSYVYWLICSNLKISQIHSSPLMQVTSFLSPNRNTRKKIVLHFEQTLYTDFNLCMILCACQKIRTALTICELCVDDRSLGLLFAG